MTLVQAFDDHIKLAVRLQSGKPLRAHRPEPNTAQTLLDELAALEQTREFEARARLDGFDEARYAVDALINAAADAVFKGTWARRNADAHVGHNFYTCLIAAHDRGEAGRQVLDVYALCALVGFSGDLHARSQDRVSRAITAAADVSPECAIGWRPVVPAPHRGMTSGRRLVKVAALTTVITYLACLWGLRLAAGL